eukprot:1136588-Pelagomonas_calceolata.AAC.1
MHARTQTHKYTHTLQEVAGEEEEEAMACLALALDFATTYENVASAVAVWQSNMAATATAAAAAAASGSVTPPSGTPSGPYPLELCFLGKFDSRWRALGME